MWTSQKNIKIGDFEDISQRNSWVQLIHQKIERCSTSGRTCSTSPARWNRYRLHATKGSSGWPQVTSETTLGKSAGQAHHRPKGALKRQSKSIGMTCTRNLKIWGVITARTSTFRVASGNKRILSYSRKKAPKFAEPVSSTNGRRTLRNKSQWLSCIRIGW